jgi:predicted translin family RNA/ssDNA-binding protein
MKKEQKNEVKEEILQKLSIIKTATEAASHKISKEKMSVAQEWVKEIHETVKKLTKYCDENLK